MIHKIRTALLKSKYILLVLIFSLLYIFFFDASLTNVLPSSLTDILSLNNISILIGIYSISFVVVSLVTILTSKGNYILWVDLVDYQLIDNMRITLKDMYFLLVVLLCSNTFFCFSNRIMECLIGYVLNIILLFLMIYIVMTTFYIKDKIIKKLEHTYREKKVHEKEEILNKLFYLTCENIENNNLSKIEESLTFVERMLLKDYKTLDFCEKFSINIYKILFYCLGKNNAGKALKMYRKYRKQIWYSTDIQANFFEKVMRKLLERDYTLTSICCISHPSMYSVSAARNEIYLKLQEHLSASLKLNKDEKLLLCRMYLGLKDADDVVNLLMNKRNITCILYDYFFNLLNLGLDYKDLDILCIVDNSMRDLQESILKKYILNISYNKTREYYIQWEKWGQHTLFDDFYQDLDDVYKKLNDLIVEQETIPVDSIYGNELLQHIQSIKTQLYTLIMCKILVIECPPKKQLSIHVQDISRMHLKAVILDRYTHNPYHLDNIGISITNDCTNNTIIVKQEKKAKQFYLVFLKEFDWLNKSNSFSLNIVAHKWKIPANRFKKKDYEFKEPSSSEFYARTRNM